jgi:hypothetical protein
VVATDTVAVWGVLLVVAGKLTGPLPTLPTLGVKSELLAVMATVR